jgi:hypothetical protein
MCCGCGKTPARLVLRTDTPNPDARRLGTLDACLVLAAIVAALAVLRPLHALPLGWDEVDYANAASLGAATNVWDAGALVPKDVWALVLAKARGQPAVLDPLYREQGDPLVLRHYHPPFVVLLMTMIPRGSEQLVRLVQAAGAVALLFLLAWSYRRLGGRGRSGLLLVLILGMWMVRHLSASLSFHGWLAVWVVLAATLLRLRASEARSGPDLRLTVALAAAALTLESAALVWVAAAGYLLLRGVRLRGIIASLSLAFLFVLLAWPGAVGHLSMVRTAGVYVYRILAVGEEYRDVSSRLPAILVTVLPGGLAYLAVLVALAKQQFNRDETLLPLWMISTAYLFGLMSFALAPQYLLPGIAPVCVAVALVIDRAAAGVIRCGVPILLVVTVAAVWPGDAEARAAQIRATDLRWLASAYAGRRLYVDGGQIFKYYYPSVTDVEDLHVSMQPPCFFLREHMAYHPLTAQHLGGGVFALSRERAVGEGCEQAAFAQCRRHERLTFVVFDCGSGFGVAAGVAGP